MPKEIRPDMVVGHPDSAESDNFLVVNARIVVSTELKKKKTLQQPIAKFDTKAKRVYLENPDGTTQEFGGAMQQGQYSERVALTGIENIQLDEAITLMS